MFQLLLKLLTISIICLYFQHSRHKHSVDIKVYILFCAYAKNLYYITVSGNSEVWSLHFDPVDSKGHLLSKGYSDSSSV